jgi:hypothetical protein
VYTNLPIFKQALDLNVYIEEAVRNFSRFHKYGIGSELREKAREILYSIYRVYFSTNKIETILKLRDIIEELKITIYLAKELKSLRDFKQFQILSKMARELAKQAQGWLNSQNHYPQKG